MSLKLIRSAQIATTKNKDILVAEHVRTVLETMGLDATPVKESIESAGPDMAIAKADYDRWMNAVHDVARESGFAIRNKRHLEDIATSVLDNDPKIESQPGDKEQLKQHIVNTMWNAHKATLNHVAVTKHVAKAKEEEEMSSFAQGFRKSQGIEDEQTTKPSELLRGAVAKSSSNPYPAGSFRHDLWAKMHPEENEEIGDDFAGLQVGGPARTDELPSHRDEMDDDTSDEDNLPHDSDMDDGDIEGADDLDDQPIDDDHDDESAPDEPEEVLADLSTEELEAELERRKGEDSDGDEDSDEDVDVDVHSSPETGDEDGDEDMDVDVSAKQKPSDELDDERDEPAESVARRVYDEEEEGKNIFRSVITKPAEHLKAALNDVAKEAAQAWHDIKLPTNPHSKKSQAFKSWEKAFRNAAKTTLGIKDPKPLSTSKRRR